MIVIRQAIKQDAKACSKVLCACIEQLCIKDHNGDSELINNWKLNKDEKSLNSWIANTNSTIYVAEMNGVICGIGAINHEGEVMLNYVSPTYRFKGVSKEMLCELESVLREQGFKKGRLHSTETALRFYKAAGWKKAGEPDVWNGIKGYPMVKQL